MGGHLPWGVSGESHRLDAQVWGPVQERQASLAGWRTSGTNRGAVGSLNAAHEEHMSAGLPSRQGGKSSALVAARFPTTASVHASA